MAEVYSLCAVCMIDRELYYYTVDILLLRSSRIGTYSEDGSIIIIIYCSYEIISTRELSDKAEGKPLSRWTFLFGQRS